MSPEDDRITGKNQSLYAEPLDEVFTPYRKEWLKNWFERFSLEDMGQSCHGGGEFTYGHEVVLSMDGEKKWRDIRFRKKP